MNKGGRLLAGAAAACALVTPSAALADSSPNPSAPDGVSPGGPPTTLPLPEDVARCLIEAGFPIPSSGSQLALPTTTGALPSSLSGTLPVAGAPPLTGTSTTATPVSGTGTIPLPGTGGAAGTIPVPGLDGSTPLPGGATSSYPGVQCGQIIINSTIYMVFVPVTTTTTTTTTTADGPIAAGPVTTTAPAPAAGSTPATPVAPAERAKQRRSRRRHSRDRNQSKRHQAQRKAGRGKQAVHIVLVRKERATGLPR